MPLGTIVRLLDNHGRSRQKVVIGCLNNFYKSVVDMSTDNFQTEACKQMQMLINPKSVKESLCRKLKINIDDTEATIYFMCPMSFQRKSRGGFFSNFNTSKCEMLRDDLKIEIFSWDLFRKKIKDLGCVDLFDEAMTLLRSLFTSETPLTTTLFPFQSSSHLSTIAFKPSISPCDSVLGQVLSLKVYLSKKDRRKVVYAECGEGFIDLICTFLVLPLDFNGLSGDEINIIWYYSCRKNLLGITVQNQTSFYHENGLKHVSAIDPKTERSGQPRSSGGFVKSNKKFLVSDDLKITPLMSDLSMRELDDVTIEHITIGRVEAINLLKASFATSSALTNGLSDLHAKKLEV
ncbi:hypothetical protein N665_0068s0016 [Sinapis alba]|nr:hypothetical protein N665_0068s0016 [Sinapis alba]